MIDTILNVDDICKDCHYFSPETNHTTTHDGLHMIYISCDHHELCCYLQARFIDVFREIYNSYYERISNKETGGTICEKAHRGQETIGLERCVGRYLAIMHVVG